MATAQGTIPMMTRLSYSHQDILIASSQFTPIHFVEYKNQESGLTPPPTPLIRIAKSLVLAAPVFATHGRLVIDAMEEMRSWRSGPCQSNQSVRPATASSPGVPLPSTVPGSTMRQATQTPPIERGSAVTVRPRSPDRRPQSPPPRQPLEGHRKGPPSHRPDGSRPPPTNQTTRVGVKRAHRWLAGTNRAANRSTTS